MLFSSSAMVIASNVLIHVIFHKALVVHVIELSDGDRFRHILRVAPQMERDSTVAVGSFR